MTKIYDHAKHHSDLMASVHHELSFPGCQVIHETSASKRGLMTMRVGEGDSFGYTKIRNSRSSAFGYAPRPRLPPVETSTSTGAAEGLVCATELTGNSMHAIRVPTPAVSR